MELLKSFFAIIIFLTIANIANSQESANVITSFKNSYNYEKEGEYSKAISEVKKVYSEESYAYEINLRLAWLHYLSGLFTESSAYYKKAITLRPYSIEAKLGYVYPLSALGNWTIIESQYNEILIIDPQNYTANYRQGLICYGRKQYDKAVKYFEKIANLYPFDYDAINMYAWTNLNIGQTRKAQVLFNKLLLISPENESALEGLKLIK